MRVNKFKRKIKRGEICCGMEFWALSPALVEVSGFLDFDYVWIENEHISAHHETLENMVRAAEIGDITPILRVEDNEPNKIRKAFEIGFQGIVVPHVNTKDDAVRAVNSAKFHSKEYPNGELGAAWGIRGARYRVSNWSEWIDEINQETIVLFMIEEQRAIDNLDEILSIKGIDIVAFGPTDFCISLDIDPAKRFEEPLVEKALDTMIRKAKRNNVAVCTTWRPQEMDMLIDKGVQIFICGNDIGAFRYRSQEVLKAFEKYRK